MALNLYRRHGSHCVGGRELHDMSYETDELRRSWKKCCCPIYVSGTLDRRFKRKNTERTNWDEAKALVRVWEDANSWDGPAEKLAPVIPAADAPPPSSARITIADTIEAFLAIRDGSNIAPATLRKYRT